jgi:hypothetical protein
MQNSRLKDSLRLAILSLLAAVLVVAAVLSLHFLPYRTVAY